MNTPTPLSFVEVQRLGQPWLWAILLPASVLLIGLFGYGTIQQLVFGQPWGSKPMSNAVLLFMGPAFVLLGLGLPLFMYALKMTTHLDNDGLTVRFFPLGNERIPLQSIASVEAKTYNALKEYGGWGVRTGSAGKAYNTSGDQGVQLILQDGSRLLIGSQRADELASCIKAHLGDAEAPSTTDQEG